MSILCCISGFLALFYLMFVSYYLSMFLGGSRQLSIREFFIDNKNCMQSDEIIIRVEIPFSAEVRWAFDGVRQSCKFSCSSFCVHWVVTSCYCNGSIWLHRGALKIRQTYLILHLLAVIQLHRNRCYSVILWYGTEYRNRHARLCCNVWQLNKLKCKFLF